jgi:hypothetical protein
VAALYIRVTLVPLGIKLASVRLSLLIPSMARQLHAQRVKRARRAQ